MSERQPSGNRRRRHRRVEVPADALLCVINGSHRYPVLNVSIGGILVATQQRFGVGVRVVVGIDWNSRHLELSGRVTHRRVDSVGIAFSDPPEQALGTLEMLMAELVGRGAGSEGHRDRRRSERSPVDVGVVLSDGTCLRTLRLRNLSTAGAYARGECPAEVGQTVIVYLPAQSFSVGESFPSELRGCHAKIMRADAKGVGMAFVHPSAEFRMVVAQILGSVSGASSAARRGSPRRAANRAGEP